MTKLEALLRRLLLMRRTEPTAKALVFSQFPDALALASRALTVLEVRDRQVYLAPPVLSGPCWLASSPSTPSSCFLFPPPLLVVAHLSQMCCSSPQPPALM